MAFSVLTSTPVKGSSSKIILLCCANARAKNTRFFCPPESSPICRSAKCSMFTRCIASSTFCLSSAFGMRRKFM